MAYWKNEEVHCGYRLRSLMPPDVLPFLRYNLHWRILDVSFHFAKQISSDHCTQSHGLQRDPRTIDSLRVTVGSQEVRLPTEYGGRPDYGIEHIWPDVATGA